MLHLWTILLWWIPAISHHSVLFIFRRSLLQRLSEHQISALCQTWTFSQILAVEQQRKHRIHHIENLLGQLRKRISNRPLNPKPIGLRRMLFLVLQKDRREGLPGSNSVWHFIRFEHRPTCSFRWRFDRRRGTICWLCVLYWSFLWRPQWRRVDTMYGIFQRGAHTVCWYEGRFCLWALSGINTVLFLVCILRICHFLNYVNILFAFCVNYSPPQIRNTCAPN